VSNEIRRSMSGNGLISIWVCYSGGGGDFRGGLKAAMVSKPVELWDWRLSMEIWRFGIVWLSGIVRSACIDHS
jgi:hypothetical protein